MGITAWLRQKRLERKKKGQARRLAEVRISLQKLRTREPLMRPMIQPELARISELGKQLNKVKSEEELRFWRSLFKMCVPLFKALLSASPADTKTRRPRKDVKK